jgi:hypothetical protein
MSSPPAPPWPGPDERMPMNTAEAKRVLETAH